MVAPEVRTIFSRPYSAPTSLGHDCFDGHHTCYELRGYGQALERLSSSDYQKRHWQLVLQRVRQFHLGTLPSTRHSF